MTRKEYTTYDNDLTAASMKIETILEVWGTNSSLHEKKTTLELSSFDLDSDWTNKWSKSVVLAPNSSTELFKGPLPGQPTRTKLSQIPKNIIVSARLIDEDGVVAARYANW
jgi:beta-mannosidase